MKILYLGLRPKPGVYHYPVIRTEPCGDIKTAFAIWNQFTHAIFTSQTTVEYWPGPWDKRAIAIGAATASALRERGVASIISQAATQEGVINLIKDIKGGSFFLPHSKRARPNLIDYMQKNQIPFFSLPLYDTQFQKLEPVPNLNEFDEIVFTSPSTVEGFLRIYGKLPRDKKLTPIGPITQKALDQDMITPL